MHHKILAALLGIVILLSGCTRQPQVANFYQPSDSVAVTQTPRSFLMGVSGFAPQGFPTFTASALSDYWKDINASADIYGVHVNWDDTALIQTAAANFNGTLEIVLGFQNPAEWTANRDEVLQTAREILQNYPQVSLLAIGNEVNLLAYDHPAEFDQFISSYTYIYEQLTQEFPQALIATTFQYDALFGEADLMGPKGTAGGTEVFNKLKDRIDLLAITAYPFMRYKSPAEIPADYFAKLATDLPIAITETGWPSRTKFVQNFINEQGYAGSETEQQEYLLRLLELTNKKDVRFICWLMLNDPYEWVDGAESASPQALFDSLALRQNDTKAKKIWDYWLANLNRSYQP